MLECEEQELNSQSCQVSEIQNEQVRNQVFVSVCFQILTSALLLDWN